MVRRAAVTRYFPRCFFDLVPARRINRLALDRRLEHGSRAMCADSRTLHSQAVRAAVLYIHEAFIRLI